jgi:membrane associated rhomboid family serine protease
VTCGPTLSQSSVCERATNSAPRLPLCFHHHTSSMAERLLVERPIARLRTVKPKRPYVGVRSYTSVMTFESVDALVILPAFTWLLVHGLNPNDERRITTYGLRIGDLNDVRRLCMHALVHGNPEHLVSNCVAHVLAALQFRLPPSFRTVPRSLVGGWVMAGGVVAGVWATKLDTWRRRNEFLVRNDFGIGLVRTVLGRVHRSVTSRTLFCGGSAAVAALYGFNAGTETQLAKMLGWCTVIASDVLALAAHEEGFSLTLAMDDAPKVAHAAHVGAFAFGFAVAHLFRWVDTQIRRRNQRDRLGGHQLGYN